MHLVNEVWLSFHVQKDSLGSVPTDNSVHLADHLTGSYEMYLPYYLELWPVSYKRPVLSSGLEKVLLCMSLAAIMITIHHQHHRL